MACAEMTAKLSPPPGTRFPSIGDEELPFEPRGALAGKVEFPEMLAYHSPRERQFTLLAVHEIWITAAACFEVRASDIFIDYLARNGLFRPQTFVSGGSVLVGAIEGFAEQLELAAIRLESVYDQGTLDWYERQGFVPDGPSRTEPGWGTLFPMVKSVGRVGAL